MEMTWLTVAGTGRPDGPHGVPVHVDAVVHARREALRGRTTVLGWVVGPSGGTAGAVGVSGPVRCPVRFTGAQGAGPGELLMGRASFDITVPASPHRTHRLVVHAAEAVEGVGAAEREVPFTVPQQAGG